MKIKNLIRIAMLGAIGYVLLILEFPIFPAAPFLKLNGSDLPALLAAFSMGPLSGFLVVILTNLLHLLQTGSGGVGELANVLVSGALVLTAGLFYRRFHTKRGAFLALCLASVVMIGMAGISNRLILLPAYMPGAESSVYLSLILSAILPFNAIKAVLVTILTMLLYKPLSPLLKW